MPYCLQCGHLAETKIPLTIAIPTAITMTIATAHHARTGSENLFTIKKYARISYVIN